jgi:hypothetical protein
MYWLIILTLLEGGLYAKPIQPFPSYADCQFALHGAEIAIKEEYQTIVCLKMKKESEHEASEKIS